MVFGLRPAELGTFPCIGAPASRCACITVRLHLAGGSRASLRAIFCSPALQQLGSWL